MSNKNPLAELPNKLESTDLPPPTSVRQLEAPRPKEISCLLVL
tara:strand:+ start:174 stop:302 length:129 start_codon:yes stop_codon:yes gene_type:complete